MAKVERIFISKEKPSWVYLLIFILVVFIQYGKTLSYGFVWDDKIVIEENPRIKKGLSSVPDLFRKFKSIYRHDQYGYRPITLTTFAIEIEMWGVNPYYHHLMNLLYYALVCFVLFIFISRLFHDYIRLFAFLAVLLYAVHPLHVEVVANIKSRDELLVVLFGTLSLIFYLRFLRNSKWVHLAVSILFYVLAFLSKENAVTLTLIYPLVYFYEKREAPFANLKKLIFSNVHIVLLFLLSIMAFYFSESSELGKDLIAEQNVVKEDDILGNSLFHTDGFFSKLPTVIIILFMYLKLFILPWPLVFYYGYNQVPLQSWSNPLVWLLIVLLSAMAYLIYRFRHKNPELWFGALFFLASLSIYMHIIRKLSDTMADRFMFLPSMGLSVILVGAVGIITKTSWSQISQSDKKIKPAIVKKNRKSLWIIVIVSLVFAFLSYKRSDVWQSDEKLVFGDMPNLPDVSRVHYYYANILWTQIKNNPSKRVKLEKDMIAHYQRSIEIAPPYVYYARMELATYYSSVGMYQEAYDLFAEINTYFPNRGPVLLNLAQGLINLNRYDEAIPLLLRTKELAPHYSAVPYLLTLSYAKMQEFDKAMAAAEEGMQLFPEEIKIFKDAISIVYAEKKDVDNFVKSTFLLLDYGANPSVVYSRIIRQFNVWEMKDQAAYYSAEASRKSIPIKP